MAVSAENVLEMRTLGAVLAVVAEAGNYLTQRLKPGTEPCLSAVVLEADKRRCRLGVFGAFELIVADHALLAADRVQLQRTDKITALAVIGLVIFAEHLVPAADREEGDTVVNGGLYLLAASPVQILKQHLLLKNPARRR